MTAMIPGEFLCVEGAIELNPGAPRVELQVVNTGDRPVQVGSHVHFPQANRALDFRSGGSTRPPARHPRRNRGPLRTRSGVESLLCFRAAGRHARSARPESRSARQIGPLMTSLSRARYAELFGPTTGDRVRLADTDLLIEITEDRCGGPGLAGDEAVFGGGKVLRESMGQARASRADGAPDTVITGAIVVDHWGIIKADVGIRDGRIVALGKAGNWTR